MEAVEGRSVQLPCDVSSPNPADKVYMVFWFKADTGIPLYSFDVRGMPLNQAHHNSAPEVFGSRAHFRTLSEPASLVVEDIRRHDQGVYRCRVDFRNSATRSFRYNLTIIVPPEKPTLYDRFGRQLNKTVGPHDEGDDIMLTCRVIGGNPEPTVRWLMNGKVVDEEYEQNAGDVIENRLTWSGVTRKDLNSVFTCQATNTKLTDPQETGVILDLRLRPLTIELFTTDTPLMADRRYDITCVSTGSRPPAIITWYKGNKPLRRVKEDIRTNVTKSELSFIPSTDDDGKTITCRAENPNVTGLFLETHWKISVIFSPIVTLRLGSTLKADDIKEGDDVYFECHVKANPPWKKLNWLHNGVIMNHNSTARVIRSHHSLVLQKLTRHSAGRYSCVAANSEGETYSNELTFRVKYAPTCRHEKGMVIGASRSESLEIVCEIDADPPAQSFRWKFNNSGETLDVGPERFTSNGTVSVLKYTPIADLDYGTLSCWAQNAIGMQVMPCVYQLVAAGKPQSVQNCTLSNQTNSSVEVKCSPGYDGGLPQVFTLEVYTPFSALPVYNLTEKEWPNFRLSNLQADVTFKILVSAVNSKGRSPPVILEEFSFKDPEKRTADVLDIRRMSPVLGIAIGTILGVILLILLIFLNMWRSRSLFARRTMDDSPERKHDQITVAPIGNHCDDMNPDIIPAKYDPVIINRRSLYADSINHSPANQNWESRNSNQDTLIENSSSTYNKMNNVEYEPSEHFCRSTESISSVKVKTINQKKDVEINCTAIKETLMANRLPESCV
ncbi:synaptogenesis protein syg-2-like isoform X2 [Planococcus citri]